MLVRNKGKEHLQELKLLVGDCLQRWSLIELELSHAFVHQLQSKDPLGYIVWDSVISFEAKLKSLDSLYNYNLKDEELRQIWGRLNDRVMNACRQRNQIAHANYMGNSHRTDLVPYLSMADLIINPKGLKRINVQNMRHKQVLFENLRTAIQWFNSVSGPTALRDSKDVQSSPDLIKEIRKLISLKNKEPQDPPQSSGG